MNVRRAAAIVATLALACESTIISPTAVEDVTVDQTVVTLLVGEGVQLNATARDAEGVAFSGPSISWVTSNPAVARVSGTGLVAAVGVGTATITASVEGLTASAAVLVTQAPGIGVSANAVAFSAVEGSVNPGPRTVGISNIGGGTLTSLGSGIIVYNPGEPTGWLSGAVNATRDSLTIRAVTGTLPPGTYQARIPLLSDDAANSPLNVFVTFTVDAAVPVVALSDAFVSFSAFGGGANPAAQTVTVTNSGTGAFSGLTAGPVAYAPGQATGWLSVGVAGDVVTLQATTGSLLAGNYLASVPVTAGNAGNTETIVVGFSVAPTGPAIGVFSSSVAFSGTENGSDPAPDTVGVVNLGSGVLDMLTVGTVTYGTGQPTGWLSGALTGTAAPTSVVITASTAGLPAGAYTATLPITSSVATNSPVTIDVSLVLSGSDSIRFDPASGVTATVNTPVAPAATVIVVDANGAPAPGRVVTFAASGGGSVAQAADTTDTNGRASVGWTLGTVAATDSDTLDASLPGGLTTRWVATAAAGMVTQLTVGSEPGGAVSGTAFATQPTIQLADAFGNAVAQAGTTVTAARSLGAGTLAGTTQATTNASGIATFADLSFTDTDSVTALGNHRLDFTSGSLTMVSSQAFNVDVSFVRNVQLVIQTVEGAASGTCAAVCHSGYTSRTNLVGAATTFNPGCGTLVVAADTANSILYQKVIAGGDWCGNARMPTGDTLSTVRQNIIRDWIIQGALQN